MIKPAAHSMISSRFSNPDRKWRAYEDTNAEFSIRIFPGRILFITVLDMVTARGSLTSRPAQRAAFAFCCQKDKRTGGLY
jgi:hypothetical protein